MKKLYAIMMLCATALSPLYAQTGDTIAVGITLQQPPLSKYFNRIDYGVGFGIYQLYNGNEKFTNVLGNFQMGFNLPVVYLSQEASIGLNPSLGVEAQLFHNEYHMYSLYIPVYATIKYGTDATWSSTKSRIGFTAGIGYRYTTASFGIFSDETSSYGLPSYILEFNFGRRNKSLLKARFSNTVGQYTWIPKYEYSKDDYIDIGGWILQFVFIPSY